MDQHWHQEATLREIAESANKVKAEAARQETEKQIETALAFLRKKAAQGLFEAEYSGPLNEEARRRLANSRNKLKIEQFVPASVMPVPEPIWLIKW